MKITFLLTRRVPDVPSPVLRKVCALLTRRGHLVDGWVPEDRLLRTDTLMPEADLYVLKSHTEAALSVAGVLHDHGAVLLNSFPACMFAQDKITATARLRAAGVAAPATWVTGDLSRAEELLEVGPLIVKPHRGHRGAHVHLVRTPAELADLPPVPAPAVVQRYVPGPGEDLKVYVAGEQVFAVRKPFDVESFTRPGRPVAVSREVRDLAAKVRSVFGLDLFGVDVIESPDGPVVVDVNYFPGYKGIRDTATPIADVITAYMPTEAAVS
ncbi:MAG: ATP-grasp domain-containing protein [Sporichthyaceae bacterium]|nr:ATP-grasp domain-containing protein [Sporichthyaceae bacterium]